MNTFRPFSPLHALTLAGCAAATVALILVARLLHSRGRLPGLEIPLGLAALAVWIAQDGSRFLPGQFTGADSWPLQLCDLAALIAPLAILLHRRWLYTLLYFWGIGLSSQGLITPELGDGPATLHYWLFWFRHVAIVGGAFYVVFVHRYRPTWADLRLAMGGALVYLVLVLPLDVAFGFNYGYVGNAMPPDPSLVDFLGPWPWRVVLMAGLAALIMTTTLLPWDVMRRVSRGDRSAA